MIHSPLFSGTSRGACRPDEIRGPVTGNLFIIGLHLVVSHEDDWEAPSGSNSERNSRCPHPSRCTAHVVHRATRLPPVASATLASRAPELEHVPEHPGTAEVRAARMSDLTSAV